MQKWHVAAGSSTLCGLTPLAKRPDPIRAVPLKQAALEGAFVHRDSIRWTGKWCSRCVQAGRSRGLVPVPEGTKKK